MLSEPVISERESYENVNVEERKSEDVNEGKDD